MNILSRIFEKRGIKDVTELSAEERVDYDKLENIQKRIDTLSGEKMTVEMLKDFCLRQVDIIESRWRATDGEQTKAGLIPYHTVYKVIIQAIDAPMVERAQLEKYLNQIIIK